MTQPKSIFERIALKWIKDENEYFQNQAISEHFFKLTLLGNKRTGDQIEYWKSPTSEIIDKLYEDFAKNPESTLEIPKGGSMDDFHKLLTGNNVPKKLPEIGKMVLYKSSKISDFISGSFLKQYGLIINEKTRNVLTDFNLGNYKCFQFDLIHKDKVYPDYYFLRNSASITEHIDYEKSKFYIQKGLLNYDQRENVNLNSLKDIEELRKEVSGKEILILASELVLNEKFPNFDLFKSDVYGVRGIYISEQLKNALNNLSGIEIEDNNRIKNWC
jgi:hypothetical protein